MPAYQVLQWSLVALWAMLLFAYGACLGSLTNVIAYRTPRGESIVRPPSRCPKCNTKLSWRDNIPVFGWIFLRGKCRYCKTRISAEYPIVEASVGLLFVLFYLLWYVPNGIHIGAITFTPRWPLFNGGRSWPEFVVLLSLLASLFAMTLVDAKTFTIPIWLTWVPAVVAVLFHPLHAAWAANSVGVPLRATYGWTWSIASPGSARWDVVGMSLGGILGIGLGLILLKAKLIGRSFADYAEWEAKAKAAEAAATIAADGPPAIEPSAAQSLEPPPAAPTEPVAPSTTEGPPATNGTSDPAMWMAYPHARREMIRELAFLAPCVLLMIAGWYLGTAYGGVRLDPVSGRWLANFPADLWLTVLSGVLMGYLVGGGIVWAVRIFGSLAFGKEAMGMGDVHLMAGVGAALGWIDATLGFFGAAFVGLAWAILGRLAGGRFQRMLPYGPFLAISTVLVLLCKPLLEVYGSVQLFGKIYLFP